MSTDRFRLLVNSDILIIDGNLKEYTPTQPAKQISKEMARGRNAKAKGCFARFIFFFFGFAH